MRIVIFVREEVAYQHLKNKLSKHEIAPFASSEKAIRMTLGSFEADVAIVDTKASWTEKIEQTLSRLGVLVVQFNDDFRSILEQTDLIASQFEDYSEDFTPTEKKDPGEFKPSIVTERYDLEKIPDSTEEEIGDAFYVAETTLLKKDIDQDEETVPEAEVKPLQETKQPGESIAEKTKKVFSGFPKLSKPKLPDMSKLMPPKPNLTPDEAVDLELFTPENRIVYRDRPVGTAVVAVMGISAGVGTTHTATLIANYLARKKERVALIEACDSYAFSRIEKIYHDIPEGTVLRTDHFEAFGVHYYKSSDQLDLIQMFSEGYSYIVLDLGGYELSDHFNEFLRAGIPVLVASGGEWKYQDIYRFCRQNRKFNQTNWNISIPLVTKESLTDIKKGMETDVKQIMAIPYHPDPFDKQADTDESLKHLLQIQGKRKGFLFK